MILNSRFRDASISSLTLGTVSTSKARASRVCRDFKADWAASRVRGAAPSLLPSRRAKVTVWA